MGPHRKALEQDMAPLGAPFQVKRYRFQPFAGGNLLAFQPLEAACAAGLDPKQTPLEIGEIIAGAHLCRVSQTAVTIADLTGTGARDTAIATHVFAAIDAAGTIIST